MHHLRQRDLRSMLKFCHSLLAPCRLEDFPQQVLSHLAEVVPSEISSFFEANIHTRSISTQASSLGSGSHLVHSAIEATAHRHFPEHPLVAHYLQTKDGRAYKISDFLSESELHRLSGVYEQFLHPLGMEDQFVIVLAVPSARMGGCPKQNMGEKVSNSLSTRVLAQIVAQVSAPFTQARF
ncbi:MAG: hypothetical protein RM338_06570 [Nostoc sp. DedQUE12a]|nr:hypothetical protein [Nostoc sp. DedQUE12a]